MSSTALIHYTEGMIAQIAGKHYDASIGDFWISFVIFLVAVLISLVYFAVLTPDIDWQLDLLLAIILGSVLTLTQSTLLAVWSSVLGHFAAMTSAILLALFGFRYAIRLPRWTLAISASILVTLIASLLITIMDYGPYIVG